MTAVIAVAVHFFDPSSDHNRLKRTEEVEKFQQETKELRANVLKLNRSTNVIEDISNRIDEHGRALDYQSHLMPEIAWRSAQLN